MPVAISKGVVFVQMTPLGFAATLALIILISALIGFAVARRWD